MKLLSLTAYILLFVPVAHSAAVIGPVHTVETFAGPKTGGFIVRLKPGVSRSAVLKKISLSGNTETDWKIFNGFSGQIDSTSLKTLRSLEEVESIAEDGIVHIQEYITQLVP